MDTTVNLRYTKVCNLEVAFAIHEEILQLDISVSNAMSVQIMNSAEELLEETEAVLLGIVFNEQSSLDQRVNLIRAVFHYVVPTAAMRT
jgi:hypothetical protein